MGTLLSPREIPTAFLTSQLGRAATRAALRSGQYTSVRRGALVPVSPQGSPWQERDERALAGIASVARKLRNDSAFSHRSAALVHGLWVPAIPPVPEVTQRTKPNAHGATSLRRYYASVPPDTVRIAGIRVTTIERTIADCARTLHPRDALAVADSGMRALVGADRRTREADVEQVAELRARLLTVVDSGPPRGRRQARAVVAAADPYSESPKETTLRWIIVSRGLPPPTTQLQILTRGGTFYVDLGWRWVVRRADGTEDVYVVVLEYDGDIKYLPDGGIVGGLEEAAAALVAEKRREDLIRENPRTSFLRFNNSELHTPDVVLTRVLDALPAAARARLRPIPELRPY